MRKGTAFRNNKEKRETIRDRVFALISSKRKGISTYQVKAELSLRIHTLSGRLSELEQAGLIYQKGRADMSIYGIRSVTIWQRTPKELIEARRVENYNKRRMLWVNKGLKNKFMTAQEMSKVKTQGKLF